MPDSLEEFLQYICDNESLHEKSEAAVCTGIVLPLLRLLGWNPDDPEEVFPQFPVSGKWVDYSLRIHGNNKVFIEAKKADEDLEKHQKQLLEYTFKWGVGIGALTNGTSWWLYLPLQEGPFENKKFLVVDIYGQKIEAAAANLRQFLSKEAIADGLAVSKAQQLLVSKERQRRISETLPKVWAAICKGADDLPDEFFAPIYQKVESDCGYRPDKEQVVDFLSHLGDLPSRSSERIAPPTTPKADRVMEILEDGRWHTAPELREKLRTDSINAVLYSLAEAHRVELVRDRRGNKVRKS
jgi:hypothetical protein